MPIISARKLRNAMLRQGLTVSTCAIKAGLSPSHVSNLLKGDKTAQFSTITKLAKLFGVDPVTLIVDEPNP